MKTLLLLFLLFTSTAAAQSVSPLPNGRTQFSNSSGLLVGGFVYTCVGGSVCPGTPLATYTDYTGGSQNTNPITLDAHGSASIWLTPSTSYKLVIEDSLGVVQWTEDGIVANPVGSSVTVSYQNLNGIRFPDQFAGANATAKQDAAITDIGAGPGLLFDTANLTCGVASSIPNNVLIMDWRQCEDIVPGPPNGSTTRPERPQVLLLKQNLGEYDTISLTGTFTLTDGSTTVTGVGTAFDTELSTTTYLAPVIKLSSASTTTCWAKVASVADATHLTLAANEPAGCGGSGTAVQMRGQLGIGVQANISGGFPNTQAMGEYSSYQAIIHRSAGTRGIYGANYNLRYDTPATANDGQAYGVEVDILNASGVDDATSNNSYGILDVSAGTNIAGTGLFVGSVDTTNLWTRGAFISGYQTYGLLLQNTNTGNTVQAVHIIPNATDVLTFNPAVCVADVADATCTATLNFDGSSTLKGDLRMNAAASTNSITLTGKALASTPVFSTSVTGDTIPRFEILADGTIEWGPGSGALDATLSRTGVGELTVVSTLKAGQFNSTIATGTAPLVIASTTQVANLNVSSCTPGCTLGITSTAPITNLNAYPFTVSHAGTQLVGPHIVQDQCTLGTSCSVTLVGSAIFADTNYVCMARDVTTAANVVTIAKTSVSQIDFTGTGTDVIEYICNGR